MDRLKDTMRVADAHVSAYDAIYLTGATGCASTSTARTSRA